MSQKTGVVDVGGGMRGIYATGVLDFCLDAGIRFDIGVGISAGSANLASFAAGQARRNGAFLRHTPSVESTWAGGTGERKVRSWIWTIFTEP